jgi:predicted MFS family arabinose efflux permease
MGLFGAVSGLAFVAISLGLAAASTPETRGLVMGGYSTMLYVGLALGSFALGPVVSHSGYAVAFGAAGVVGVVGVLTATEMCRYGRHRMATLTCDPMATQT